VIFDAINYFNVDIKLFISPYKEKKNTKGILNNNFEQNKLFWTKNKVLLCVLLL